MTSIKSYLQNNWLGNLRLDVLSGLVVGLALIPEAIAFSIIAGVDPKVGLYASFCIAVVISFLGGRPAMISAATAAMALIMITLVKDHGLEYLLAASVLCGVIQFIMGVFKMGNLMRFVSRGVVIGFVNALAILIFAAQLPELDIRRIDVSSLTIALTVLGLGIIYLFPRLPKLGQLIPSPLISIVVLTALVLYFGADVRQVGDLGDLPDTLPIFLWPDVPLNLETLQIILPYALALAVVGLLESMMTATIVDELTDTDSDKNRECRGQGISNIVAGSFGGMAGCAMIGQSVINVKSGGRTRLSTLIAGVWLIILCVALNDYVGLIPMAALVAIMIMVSIGTFNWASIRELKTHPLSFNIVMLSTVLVTVITHNLALGVFTGVLLSAIIFASKIAHFLRVTSSSEENGRNRTYLVQGQVFFASSGAFIDSFDVKEALQKVVIDVNHAHFWDVTAIHALDKVVSNFEREGVLVELNGLNKASQYLVDRYLINPSDSLKIIDAD
jgi:SulP family sulfate permease